MDTQQKILMCSPDHFAVDYIINPWMQGNRGQTEQALALEHWQKLEKEIALHAETTFITPERGLPDLVFTANAGFVINNQVVVSRFRTPERQREEPYFKKWFIKNGFSIIPWPLDVSFEGAGDALLDRQQPVIWSGYGFRSDQAASSLLTKFYKRETIALHLIDPRFYHLDTCLCPLPGGYLMYYPSAFDDLSQKIITDRIDAKHRIIVTEDDALAFSCNAVDIDGIIIMNGASQTLQDRLTSVGLKPVIIPLGEFMKAGGAAKCLTLKLMES